MSSQTEKVKIIFGLKIRQLRLDKGLLLSDIAERAGFSISYLNEIERGKKYPKTEKIMALARVFETDYDTLVSLKMSSQLEPLTDFLNSPTLSSLPLYIFGIETPDLVELMSGTPSKISVFISTITELSRTYGITTDDFFQAVLRAYIEHNNNYFEDLEQAAQEFRNFCGITKITSPNSDLLEKILKEKYQITVGEFSEDDNFELKKIKSFYKENNHKLLINRNLTTERRNFVLAKEIGFQYLNLKNRPFISPSIEKETFEEILNNFRASYFAGAVLINRDVFVERLTYLFASPKWHEEAFLSILNLFNTTPEVALMRFSSVLSGHFNKTSQYILRIQKDGISQTQTLKKEIHLNGLHPPYLLTNPEHYCNRWSGMTAFQKEGICTVQISEFEGFQSTFLEITLLKKSTQVSDNQYAITLGLKVNESLKNTLQFINDSKITRKTVNQTCERCSIQDCNERVFAPIFLQEKQRILGLKEHLKSLK
jgi:XRE family transcriptional regulator, fatty acid utilization regulator